MGLAGFEPYYVSFKETEALLYNRRLLQLFVDQLTPCGHGGLMFLGTGKTNRPGSPVEDIALRRARLSIVLTAIDRVYRSLSRESKRLIDLRYFRERPLTWREVADRVHVSERAVYNWRNKLIPEFQQAIRGLGKRAMLEFWRAYEAQSQAG